MNAPHPFPPLRDRQADRAEAERLVGELYKQVTLVNDAAERETSTIALAELVRLSTDLRFAADLLYAYQAGLAVADPDPVTGCYLVERIAVTTALPDEGSWVMVWTDGEGESPWLAQFDGLSWWFMDSEPALSVTHWAHRPGVPQ
jgi:hypothetical protein